MKIYVAARFGERDKVRLLYERLEKLGYEISHKWTEHQENWSRRADEDLQGVSSCDVFMLLHTEDGGQSKFVEYGAALAHGKTCVIVNPNHVNNCMFFYHPNVCLHYDLDSAISMLSRIKEQL